MKNVPAGTVSCNAVRDAIVHELVANIGGCDSVASAEKKKILETKKRLKDFSVVSVVQHRTAGWGTL